ncbi:anti sigma factor C-terminal domain-containing protein [Sporosarcina sp. JAI121]|uniref:anti sigma factor C-terminal domain-containing protein n=1 Tax=Sporosarcina sp. JAI121 TaxID=2723064 RepID=UPI0015CD060A|nr:anti sigma factor C-terminal domain-containing protein [Sporosarcina sp. JAI121]NYF26125.1 hypothetical protein [Sporosarcina sp. JAI121]
MSEKSIFDPKDTYQPTIKKAKKKSLKRTILVSIAVTLTTVIVGVVIFLAAHLYMQKTMTDYYNLQVSKSIVRGANITLDNGGASSYGIESAITQDQYRKNIDGIPYTWYNEQTLYKIYDKPTTLLDTRITSFDGEQYYRNGQRVMNFLYPRMKSSNDDIALLTSLDSKDKIEVAISFKEELPVDKMLEVFPTAQWAWVIDPMNRDSFDSSLKEIGSDYVSYVISEYAYGFSIQPESTIEQNVEEFKQGLQRLSEEQNNEERLLEKIQGELQVGGIVITGTVEEILPMMEQEQVNYVSVGVIIPQ